MKRKRFRRCPRVRLVFYRWGNCWRWWSFSRKVRWSGGLTYYCWWRFAIELDWRADWLADFAGEDLVDCERYSVEAAKWSRGPSAGGGDCPTEPGQTTKESQ